MIAFVGSVFSPYYALARGLGRADPDNFCALNVALYGGSTARWSMTERARRHCHRDARQFTIGPSRLSWDGQALTVRIRERGAPLPRPIEGEVRLEPQGLCRFTTPIDAQGRHRWGPIAPVARVRVDLDQPRLRWSGQAYLDCNEGDEPIDRGFRRWDWSRARLGDGSTAVLYDIEQRDREERLLALRFAPDGSVRSFDPPRRQAMRPTAWRVARGLRSGTPVTVQEQLEDTPFYQRAILRSELLGETVTSFHESLSVPRLVSPVVRAMLPFRMPRRF